VDGSFGRESTYRQEGVLPLGHVELENDFQYVSNAIFMREISGMSHSETLQLGRDAKLATFFSVAAFAATLTIIVGNQTLINAIKSLSRTLTFLEGPSW